MAERVAGYIEAEDLFFIGEHLQLRPGRDIGQALMVLRIVVLAGLAEESHLAVLFVGLEARSDLHCLFEAGHHLGTVSAEPVEGTCFYERFDDLLIGGP
ncbi:hypothetical protein ES703_118578 [subsurface metagenome]